MSLKDLFTTHCGGARASGQKRGRKDEYNLERACLPPVPPDPELPRGHETDVVAMIRREWKSD